MEKTEELGSISGKELIAYLLRGEDVFDADREELVKNIRTLADRMSDLVNEKLAASVVMHLCVTVTATADVGNGPDPFLTVRFGPGAHDDNEPFCKLVKALRDVKASRRK